MPDLYDCAIMNYGDDMSKFTRLQKIMLSIIALLLITALLTNGKGSTFKSIIYDPVMMLKYSVLDYPIETVKNWMEDFNELWSVKQENDILKKELAAQDQKTALIEDLQRENKELKEILGFEVTPQYHKVYARIINRNPEIYNNQISINVGSNQNVQLDNAVISSSGLIGKVIEVNDNTSRVRLLTSQDQLSKVSVQIHISEDEVINGYLERYDIESGHFVVRLYSNTNQIKVDQKVTTSGAGGVFPSGIFVGNVTQIEEMKNENGRILYVHPAADFSSFEYVAVLCEVGS